MTSQTLRLGVVGGIMIAPGKASLTLGSAANAGNLTAGGPNGNTAGELVFINNSTSGAGNAIIVNATIVDNGTGAVTVTKSGTGDLQLVGTANTYTGKTYLNGGITKIFGEGATSGSLGSVPLTVQADNLNFNGGTLQFNSAFNLNSNRGIATTGNGATIDTQAFNTSYGGVITGGGGLTKVGSGTLTLSSANTYTGLTTISGTGAILITNGSALGTTDGATTVASGASLRLQGGITINESISITGTGTINPGALNSVSGNNVWNGTINANTSVITRITSDTATDTFTINGNIVTSGTAANGLTFQGAGTTVVNGNITGSGLLTRSSLDAGTLVLTGTNTYTGATAISSGTLQVGVAGVGSTGATTIAVNVGASGAGTLAGTGTIGGLVTVASGAILSPGDTKGTSAGTLTFASGLTFNATGGAVVKMDLGSSSDLILLTGGTFTSNSSGATTFNITPGSGFGNGVYNLIDWSSLSVTPSGVDLTDFAVTGLSGGLAGTFQFDPTGRILQLAVTPEPAHAGLLGMGLFALMWRRRRRYRMRHALLLPVAGP
jgi:autotransporter-associated beta strand protein